jgi:asparagine synthase (glutamine-hydrolysing)
MCGIAGFQGRFPVELLGRMSARLAHRGPDGSGEILLDHGAGRRTGLAHRRLSIIDLSERGLQPMTTHCAACNSSSLHDLALGYNGEIYNFPELRSELRAAGHSFHSATDSEVLLHLYARDGLAFLERLNGIFALAIADGRKNGRPVGVREGDVILARDGLGVKPLYYSVLPEGTLFASELKALLEWSGVPRTLDPHAIYQTVAYLWTPAPRTMLRAVCKMQPGEALILRDGTIVRSWSHYNIPYGASLLSGAADDIAEQLRSTVFEAVRRQLVADVPVAAFLSGGLDSSAVVAAARAAGAEIQCYCAGFSDDIAASEGMVDDVPYARRVAAHLDVPLTVVEIKHDAINHLARMLYYLDEPQGDPAPINALLLCQQAHHDGFKVMLSGAGGDDMFSGYRRHRALGPDGMWGYVPVAARRVIAGLARQRLDGPSHSAFHSAFWRRSAKLLEHADRTSDERMIAFFWWSSEQLRRSLFAPDFLAQIHLGCTSEPLARSLERVRTEPSRLNRMLYLEARHFLADHNLNYTDRMGMAVGVEVRVPLLDREVVDLATRIPAGLKQRGSMGKAILKQAFEAHLPQDVISPPEERIRSAVAQMAAP